MRRYKGVLFPKESFNLPSRNSDEPVKVEKVQAPKVEKVQAPKVEKVQAPKVEKVQAPKVEKVQAPKVEKTEEESLTFSDLNKMKKDGVIKIAKGLGLEVEDKTKKELIEAILK